jgi:hypothetical protein
MSSPSPAALRAAERICNPWQSNVPSFTKVAELIDAEFSAERADAKHIADLYGQAIACNEELAKANSTLRTERAELIEALQSLVEPNWKAFASELVGITMPEAAFEKAKALLARYK